MEPNFNRYQNLAPQSITQKPMEIHYLDEQFVMLVALLYLNRTLLDSQLMLYWIISDIDFISNTNVIYPIAISIESVSLLYYLQKDLYIMVILKIIIIYNLC